MPYIAACGGGGGGSAVSGPQSIPQLAALDARKTAGAKATAGRVHTNSCNPYDSFFSFNGADGANPTGSLFQLNNAYGTLYGTTQLGGTDGSGTMFTISVVNPRRYFIASIPGKPVSGLIDVNGELYGTASEGGLYNSGYVFRISTSGSKSDLYDFRGSPEGANPRAGLIDLNGSLFGTTFSGGKTNAGTVFKVTTSGTESVLHSFSGVGDGQFPLAPLVEVNDQLYGTKSGGTSGGGTVFAINPSSGQENVLHSFGDVAKPVAGLINVNGELYGTASGGGSAAYPYGFVFKISTSGIESHVYTFKGCSGDGYNPQAPLLDLNGTLYGTTANGGAYTGGTLFRLSTSGRESVLHSFGTGSDGATPLAGLIYGSGFLNKVLWGTTYAGGTSNHGTIFYYGGCNTIGRTSGPKPRSFFAEVTSRLRTVVVGLPIASVNPNTGFRESMRKYSNLRQCFRRPLLAAQAPGHASEIGVCHGGQSVVPSSVTRSGPAMLVSASLCLLVVLQIFRPRL